MLLEWTWPNGKRPVEVIGGTESCWFLDVHINLQADPQAHMPIASILDRTETLFLQPIRQAVLKRLHSEHALAELPYLRREVETGRKDAAIARAKANELKARRGTLVASQPTGLGAKLLDIDKQIAAAEATAKQKEAEVREPAQMLAAAEQLVTKRAEAIIAEEVKKLVAHMIAQVEKQKAALARWIGPHLQEFLVVEQAANRVMTAQQMPLSHFRDLVSSVGHMTPEELENTVLEQMAKPDTKAEKPVLVS